MSADSGATRYFGPKEDIAREKDAPPRQAASSAPFIAGLTESMKKRAEKRVAAKERKAKKKEEKLQLAKITKQLTKLTKQAEHDEQLAIIDRIALRGLQHAEGLLKKAGEDGYNPDADVPLADATTRSHFGMKVYQQMMANKREGMATQRALGVVLLQGRKSEADWNEEARRVDEEQRHAQAIDVAAEIIKEEGIE